MALKKCETENSQKLENFVAANTIMARSAIISDGNYYLKGHQVAERHLLQATKKLIFNVTIG